MPRKTNPALGSEEAEAKPKTKRKSPATRTRKKKTEGPDLSVLPGGASGVEMDSVKPVEASSVHSRHHQVEVDQSDLPAYEPFSEPEVLHDIKPRERGDATFLVPEKFGFDLKDKAPKRKSKHKTIRNLAYGLIVLIILLVGGLFLLSSYSSRLAEEETGNLAIDQQETPETGYTLAFSNVPGDLKTPLTNALVNKFGSGWGYADYTSTLPEVSADTLFVKEASKQEANDLLTALDALGIKPQIQQVNDLQSSAVLYLTPTLANPDLSGMTSAVYNATGVSGLAKQYCNTLKGYKVVSCDALNAPANQTGSTVAYKTAKVFFILKRAADFKNMQFVESNSTQVVEDIRVTVGK